MTTYGPPDFRKGPGLVDVGSGPVDWNWKVVIDEEPVFSNINNFGADAGCDGAGPILRGFNDWNNIQYVSSPATLPRPTPTISALSTTEELTALQQTDETDEQTIGNVRDLNLGRLVVSTMPFLDLLTQNQKQSLQQQQYQNSIQVTQQNYSSQIS